jgi:hypothetical protein
MRPLAATLLLAAAVALCCGCGSGSGSNSNSAEEAAAEAARASAEARNRLEAKAPKGSSTTLKAIYGSFPAPKPEPGVKGSAAALRAGEKACKGRRPTQVKEEFYGAAKAGLSQEQEKMIARIASFESHSSTDSGFTAGQLAADVYAATLPEAAAQYGYEGCVYALARGLERRLAP